MKATAAIATNGLRKLTFKPVPVDVNKENHSTSITDSLYGLFDRAIQYQYSNLPEASVLITNSKVADYQCNSAMSISQALKSRGESANPNEVAKRIVASLEKNDLIDKVRLVFSVLQSF